MDYLNLTWLLAIAISAQWVYYDAKKHKIGKVPGMKGLLNMSAGAMAGATLLLWLPTFPMYLYKRKALIEQAKEHPIEPAGKITFALTGALFAASATIFIVNTTLPGCDSQDALKLTNHLIQPLGMGQVTYPVELDYEDSVRVCRGLLSGGNGRQVPVEYSVSWHDKAKRIIYVQLLR